MSASGGRPVRCDGDEARLGAVVWTVDLSVDPGLVLRHSGVHSWEVGQSTASSKAHHSGLDPPGAAFAHQGAA